ncbi:hypothetical protein ACTFIR_008438 [Dictyostelium discoideum]
MLSKEDVEKMNVKELQKELTNFGLDTKGKKAELQTRLLEHINKNGTSSPSSSSSSPTTQKTDSTSTVVANESTKTNIPTTTTATSTAQTQNTTAATAAKQQTNANENNIDVSTMTEEERRIHRLNKFTHGGGATASASATSASATTTSSTTTTTSSSSSSSSSPKNNKIPTAAALEEEKRKRLLKFGTAPISITSPPPLPETKVKVQKSKIHVNKKEEIYGSVNEIVDRKKKFGLASPTKSTTTAVNNTNGSPSSLSVEERKKKFAK